MITEERRLKLRIYQRKYRISKKGKIVALRKVIKMQKKYPEKWSARYKLKYAIARGEIVRCPCEVCGETKVQGHHDDYTKPLEVRWLCDKHHKELHKKLLTK